MSERERWIVYPLLFLALGAALRDKLFDQTISKRISCEELVVYGEGNGQSERPRLVEIGALDRASPGAPQVGMVVVRGQVRAAEVYADNYLYQGIPLGLAILRALPGDWLRAIQQSAEILQKSQEAARNKLRDDARSVPKADAPNAPKDSSTNEQPSPAPSSQQP